MKLLVLISGKVCCNGIFMKSFKIFIWKPLINWVIEKAFSTKLLNQALLSSYYEQLVNITKKDGIKVTYIEA